MKKHRLFLRGTAVVAMLVMLFTALCVPAFADGIYSHLDGSKYVLQKVSNPDRLEGEVDGLLPGGDRASSYCWAMAENDGYLYIGTWANGLWQMVEAIAAGAKNAGIEVTDELVDSIVDLATRGEIARCEDDSYYTAKIFRYSEETGEMELLFDPGDHAGDPDYGVITGFRAAVEFKGDVYMDALLSGRCLLYKVTDEDPYALPEIVFENGTLRAMCVSVDGETMYVAGKTNIPEGYKSAAAIFATTTGEAGSYEVIADAEDFAYYTKSGTTADFSDITTMANPAYKDGYELIGSLGTSKGIVIVRGHAASDEEIAAGLANRHGWVWTEFAGDNGEYPISFGNLYHVNLNPVVFNDELYFLSMTNPMTPLLQLFTGLVTGNMTQFYNGLDTVAKDCDIEGTIYRLTKDGTLQMVMGDKEYCDDSIEYVAKVGAGFTDEKYGTTMYIWRGITYNDRLYVNTIDYWNLFGYVTQLTNGELLGMSKDGLKTELGYLVTFMDQVMGSKTLMDKLSSFLPVINQVLNEDVKAAVENLASEPMFDMLYLLYSGLDQTTTTEYLGEVVDLVTANAEDLAAFCDKAIAVLSGGIFAESASAKKMVESISSVKSAVLMIAENKEHIENYMIISDTVAKEKNPGGEVWCTEDGINWEPITRNGFNDRYNHGVRTFAIGDDGSLYYGCANPYYGAQLWKHTDVADDYEYTGRQDPTQYEELEEEQGVSGFFDQLMNFLRSILDMIKNLLNTIFAN